MNLHVDFLNGEGCILKVSPSTLGRDVRRMLCEQLHPKRGAKLALHHFDSPLVLGQTLQEQGIVGQTSTLSCTYIPTNLYDAWCYINKVPVSEEEFALEGVTQIAGGADMSHYHYLKHLPKSQEKLTLGSTFNGELCKNILSEQPSKFDFRSVIQSEP